MRIYILMTKHTGRYADTEKEGNDMAENFVFGVDIGGTTCKAGVFTSKGELLEKWEFKTDTSNHGTDILSHVAEQLNHKIQQLQMDPSKILGIGLGVPGPVSSTGVVHGCVNLGWKEKDVIQELKALINYPVRVGNDASLAALGELYAGSGMGKHSLLMLTLGTGVGGGLVYQNHIIHGAHGAAGEIGHMIVNPKEREHCNCGRRGCLEQYVSATGICRMADHLMSEYRDIHTSLDQEHLDTRTIFEAAQNQDGIGVLVVEKFGHILGTALANLAVIYDPEMIVLGGGVSNAGEYLLNLATFNFKEKVFEPCSQVEIQIAKLGNDAGIYGCCAQFLM